MTWKYDFFLEMASMVVTWWIVDFCPVQVICISVTGVLYIAEKGYILLGVEYESEGWVEGIPPFTSP